MLDPGLYREREACSEQCTDEQDAGDGLLSNARVAVQYIGHQHADAREQAKSDATHAHAGHDPMQPVRNGDAVDEKPSGLHEGDGDQDPEAVLRLSIPAVTCSEGEDDPVVNDARDSKAREGSVVGLEGGGGRQTREGYR